MTRTSDRRNSRLQSGPTSGGGVAAVADCTFYRMLCMWFLMVAALIANRRDLFVGAALLRERQEFAFARRWVREHPLRIARRGRTTVNPSRTRRSGLTMIVEWPSRFPYATRRMSVHRHLPPFEPRFTPMVGVLFIRRYTGIQGIIGMPPAMLPSGKGADHHVGQAAEERCRMSPMRAAYR
jgi:hypothetical protein